MTPQPLELKKINQLLHGSSFPALVELSNGNQAVLKMHGAGNGFQSLIAEFYVNRVLYELGWSCPNCFPITISKNHPWEIGTDEFDFILRQSWGTNLGIEFIPNAAPVQEATLSAVPDLFLQRLIAADQFFVNFDRQLKSANILVDTHKKHWMIDHGSCLIFVGKLHQHPSTLNPNHFLKEKEQSYSSVQIMHELATSPLLNQVLNEIPSEWLKSVHTTKKELLAKIEFRKALVLDQ